MLQLEEILTMVEVELRNRQFKIEYQKKQIDELTAENADLKLKITELEKCVCPEREDRNDDYKK